ncbi:hypothetical protein EN871_27800 [bacterium M00.F.Ca.ET.228.01.1.1]|nr:hypothetical protein EN871_27800 [bacterium M00.F.Ca.ET.228.01.1.1]TGR96688.1 hypothetical protein EN834_27190 [bacterium M00.F.Ca.ET.191.01.1.1]TGT97955.1 hypothetical protein EN798_27195 [bacterium M00.F.Ca.ET.155.01.1.1]
MTLRDVPVRSLCAVALAMMWGCVPRPPVAFEPPPPAACCRSWQQVRFQEMDSNGASGVMIGIGNSPTFEFDEGRSTFVAYRLPERAFGSMTVRTYASSARLDMATVFRPRALLLDSHLRQVGSADFESMKEGSDFVRGAYYYATTSLPPNATYLVIYAASSKTTDRLVARSANGSIFGLPNAYEGKISIIPK